MTFKAYAETIFKVLLAYFNFFKRIDIVFDIYLENSLKAATREKRGRGIKKKISAENRCPGNWMQFLKEDTNKKELNEFLATTLTAKTYPSDRQLVVTYQDRALSNFRMTMPECNHEEADTRILHHVKHALSQNMTFIQILSNDTDVVIIALGVYHMLRSDFIFDDIVFEYSMGKNHRKISIKNLAESLGQTRAQALVFFHAFTGCDTTSAFKSIGKKKYMKPLKPF